MNHLPRVLTIILIIHVSFSYTATYMNEESAGGGDFSEQLSLLILKKFFLSFLKT